MGDSNERLSKIHGHPKKQETCGDIAEERIWDEPRFHVRPSGDDKWVREYLAGWLVKSHRSKGRARPFYPLQRSCPVGADRLTGRRVTMVYGIDGTTEALWDKWTILKESGKKQDLEEDILFMEVKKTDQHHREPAAGQDRQAAVMEPKRLMATMNW